MRPFLDLAVPGTGRRPAVRPRPAARLRPFPLLVVLTAAAVLVALTPPLSANASVYSEQLTLAAINATRSQHGLQPLVLNTELRAAARRHSAAMIRSNRLYHSDLGDLSGQALAENVGYGPTVEDLHAAFLASDLHRSIVLDPAMTQIGLAVDYDNGIRWVTQIFRQPR